MSRVKELKVVVSAAKKGGLASVPEIRFRNLVWAED